MQLQILNLEMYYLENCRGQAYDGAANMSGHVSGLAKRIQDDSLSVLYIHCHSHNLSLVLLGIYYFKCSV